MSNDKNYDQFDQEEFKRSAEKAYSIEDEEFEKIINQELIISLFGEVNAGKSSTINALLGKKLSEVSAYAGHTSEITLYKFDKNVRIADTPGLNDMKEINSKKAEDFFEKGTDIILFFFNAAVGCNKSMYDAYNDVKKLNKPILIVLNRIDTWYKDEKLVDKESLEIMVKQIEDNTNGKVIPISARDDINIELLNTQILRILEKGGKDILFTKLSRFKEDQVKIWIKGATVTAFGIGVIPIPGVDILPLTTLQVGLALKIAYIYGNKVSKGDIMQLIGSTITGSVGKQLFKYAVQALKGLGYLGGPLTEGAIAIAAGTIAASITYGFGWACNAYYKSGMTMDLGKVAEIFNEKFKEYKKNKDSEKNK